MLKRDKTINRTFILPIIFLLLTFVSLLYLWNNIKTPSGESSENPSSVEYFQQVTNVPSGVFKYGGSTTWAPIRKIVDPEIQKVLPRFQLSYTNPPTGETPGSSNGIRMLLNNQIDFSQSSRKLQQNEKDQGLKEMPVAIDGLAVAVNPNLGIKGLKVEQLKDIYTHKINNWEEVGGKNLEIKTYSRHPSDGGTVNYFMETVLNGEQLGANVGFVENTTDGIRKVSQQEGAIYYATASEVVGQCSIKSLPLGLEEDKLVPPYEPPYIEPSLCRRYPNRVKVNIKAFRDNSYPLTRQLYVIVQYNDETKRTSGQAYANLLLTNQGQKLIEKAGFLSIK